MGSVVRVKICRECGLSKEPGEFYRHNGSRDGLRSECKACGAELGRRYREKYPEKNSKRCDRWRRSHMEQRRASARRWRAENRETDQENARRWRAANPERHRKQSRDWRQANPDKYYDQHARRRARLLGNDYESFDRQAIYDRDNGLCHICRRRVSRKDFTLDHLIPLVHGGPHTPENVALAHRVCNSRRHDGRIPAQLRLVG